MISRSKLSFTVALDVDVSCLQPPWGKRQHTGGCDFNSASHGYEGSQTYISVLPPKEEGVLVTYWVMCWVAEELMQAYFCCFWYQSRKLSHNWFSPWYNFSLVQSSSTGDMCQRQNVSDRFWLLNLVSTGKSSLCISQVCLKIRKQIIREDKTFSSSVNCTCWLNYKSTVMERGLQLVQLHILSARLSCHASHILSLCPSTLSVLF